VAAQVLCIPSCLFPIVAPLSSSLFTICPTLATPTSHTGEHSAAEGGKFDISNKQRIGFSEVELVQKMIDGVSKLIEFEERMAAGATTADIENLIELI
jgi:creatine kinase